MSICECDILFGHEFLEPKKIKALKKTYPGTSEPKSKKHALQKSSLAHVVMEKFKACLVEGKKVHYHLPFKKGQPEPELGKTHHPKVEKTVILLTKNRSADRNLGGYNLPETIFWSECKYPESQ